MHAIRLALLAQVLIHGFGHERRKRREQAAQRLEHGIERFERGQLAALHALAPEALARAAHIPVGELIHKGGDGARGFGDVVSRQALVHGLHQGIQPGEQPFVHAGEFRGLFLLRVVAIDGGVQAEEGVDVPQRAHEFALRFADHIAREAAGQPRRAHGIEVPAHGVRALLIQHIPRVHHVALVLAHLLAVLILHVAQHQAVFKRRAVEDQRADGQQRVEPAARLVDGFGDEIRREVFLEDFLVFKGIVPLGERHGAGIVPAVDHFAGARHIAMALGALHAHAVDERLVQLDILGHVFAHFAQFGDGADGVHVPAILADPDGQRRAPIALAGEAPVDHVLQEIAHAAVLDVVGHPVDGLVVGQQLIAQRGHADEPGGARVIDQRRVAAPAEGVIVRVGLLFHQKAAAFQIGDDHGIGLFHEHARPGGFLGHAALGVHQLHEGQVVFAAHARVVLAKGGRDVHDARAVR